jgi:hypothetical protein
MSSYSIECLASQFDHNRSAGDVWMHDWSLMPITGALKLEFPLWISCGMHMMLDQRGKLVNIRAMFKRL